jgi:hypothetical protein
MDSHVMELVVKWYEMKFIGSIRRIFITQKEFYGEDIQVC